MRNIFLVGLISLGAPIAGCTVVEDDDVQLQAEDLEGDEEVEVEIEDLDAALIQEKPL